MRKNSPSLATGSSFEARNYIIEMLILCCPALTDYKIRDIVFVLYKGGGLKEGLEWCLSRLVN